MDTPEVTRLLRETVTLEVPFPPATSWWGRALRAVRRAFHIQRPVMYRIDVVEAPAAAVVDYMEASARLAQETMRRQAPPTEDVAQGIQDAAAMVRHELAGSSELFRRITGIEDRSFWDALSHRQRLAVTQAFERVNPALEEAKKKLSAATLMALQVQAEKDMAE